VPVTTSGHTSAFNKGDYIGFWISIFQGTKFAVQMIKGDIDNALHLFSRQRSEQYLTSLQFLAHFLRHSKGRAQRTQIFG
jgi:hypothetical protein